MLHFLRLLQKYLFTLCFSKDLNEQGLYSILDEYIS